MIEILLILIAVCPVLIGLTILLPTVMSLRQARGPLERAFLIRCGWVASVFAVLLMGAIYLCIYLFLFAGPQWQSTIWAFIVCGWLLYMPSLVWLLRGANRKLQAIRVQESAVTLS